MNVTIQTIDIQLEALTNRVEKGKEDAKIIAMGVERLEKQVQKLKNAAFTQMNIFNSGVSKFSLFQILEKVANAFSYDVSDMQGKSREADVVFARSVFAKIAKSSGYTHADISKSLGRACHSTISNLIGEKEFEDRLNKIPRRDVYDRMISQLEQELLQN